MPFYPKILKKTLVNLSIFTVSLCISLILLEFIIRILFPVYDPRGMLIYKYYPEDGLILCMKNCTGRLWKNTGDFNVGVRINRYGFRDGKDIASSAYGDIFVLGDSMGLGWGIEEDKRFSNVLQAIVGMPVYNISGPAADMDAYVKLLSYAQKNGARIRNLVLAICMENDLRDYDFPAKKLPEVNRTKRGKQWFLGPDILQSGFRKFLSWLGRNSAAYHAVAALLHQNDFFCRLASKFGWITPNYEGIQRNDYCEKSIVSSANKLLALTRAFNAVLVIIPSRGLWVGNNLDVERKVHEKFISLLKESGARIVDLRLVFEKTAQPLSYYFKNDGHLNEKGHLAVATELAGFFRE